VIANVTPIPLALAGVVATTDYGFSLGPGGGNTHTLAKGAVATFLAAGVLTAG
jgi:hypothetical protein